MPLVAGTREYDAAYEKALAEELSHGYMYDTGTCNMGDYDCDGWDGKSHRCDCGNRRMYWDHYLTEGDKFVFIATPY